MCAVNALLTHISPFEGVFPPIYMKRKHIICKHSRISAQGVCLVCGVACSPLKRDRLLDRGKIMDAMDLWRWRTRLYRAYIRINIDPEEMTGLRGRRRRDKLALVREWVKQQLPDDTHPRDARDVVIGIEEGMTIEQRARKVRDRWFDIETGSRFAANSTEVGGGKRKRGPA